MCSTRVVCVLRARSSQLCPSLAGGGRVRATAMATGTVSSLSPVGPWRRQPHVSDMSHTAVSAGTTDESACRESTMNIYIHDSAHAPRSRQHYMAPAMVTARVLAPHT